MKKANKIILKINSLLLVSTVTFITLASANVLQSSDLSYQPPPRESREEIYQDIFISLLLLYIQKEVGKYSSKYLVETPTVAPYSIS